MVCSKLIGFDMITYFFVNANFNMVGLFGFMVFNATFNNSSVISLGTVLSVEETGDPRENQVHHLIAKTPHMFHIIFLS
jgi:hypothetical protein